MPDHGLARRDADAAGSVRLPRVYYDSPGADTGTNANLDVECFTLTNHGMTAKTITGWTVRDPDGHVYRFGTLRLGAGKTVKVHTGKGSDTTLNRYWGQNTYVWNNSGDKAILRNQLRVKVDVCSWSGIGTGVTAC
jgi:hypothetical protein